MARRNNVVKFRRKKSINIGVVIFFIMFVYILLQIYIYYTKEHLSIYEVREGNMAQDEQMTGLIIRDEEIVYTIEAGYLSYLNKEGDRVYKNAPIYSMDDNRDIYDMVMNDDVYISNSVNNINQVKTNINYFNVKYSDIEYNNVKMFKDKIENIASLLLNNTILENIDKIKDNTGNISNFHTVYAQKSGLVSYYIDSFENINENQINLDMFNMDNYNKTNIRTTEMLASNSPAYKLLPNDNWSIIFPLNEGQLELLSNKEYIDFTFTKNKIRTTQKINIINKSGENYLKITMDKYLSLFLDDRFVEINITDNREKGMKIPLTAITNKDFFKVPNEFFTTGGNSVDLGLLKETYDPDSGDLSYEFIETNIYYEDDKHKYIDTSVINIDTWIHNVEDGTKYQIRETGELTGVFNVNKGYAEFRIIEALYEDKDYYIISSNTSNGLSLYDHIALNAQMVEENKKIY